MLRALLSTASRFLDEWNRKLLRERRPAPELLHSPGQAKLQPIERLGAYAPGELAASVGRRLSRRYSLGRTVTRRRRRFRYRHSRRESRERYRSSAGGASTGPRRIGFLLVCFGPGRQALSQVAGD